MVEMHWPRAFGSYFWSMPCILEHSVYNTERMLWEVSTKRPFKCNCDIQPIRFQISAWCVKKFTKILHVLMWEIFWGFVRDAALKCWLCTLMMILWRPKHVKAFWTSNCCAWRNPETYKFIIHIWFNWMQIVCCHSTHSWLRYLYPFK
jgi:hypothetical protein